MLRYAGIAAIFGILVLTPSLAQTPASPPTTLQAVPATGEPSSRSATEAWRADRERRRAERQRARQEQREARRIRREQCREEARTRNLLGPERRGFMVECVRRRG
jgi:hypothetical protein